MRPSSAGDASRGERVAAGVGNAPAVYVRGGALHRRRFLLRSREVALALRVPPLLVEAHRHQRREEREQATRRGAEQHAPAPATPAFRVPEAAG